MTEVTRVPEEPFRILGNIRMGAISPNSDHMEAIRSSAVAQQFTSMCVFVYQP